MPKRKKVSSITRRIQRKLMASRLGMIIGQDILLFLILSAGFLWMQEVEHFGNFVWNRKRSIILSEVKLSHLTYCIEEDGLLRFRLGLYQPLCHILLGLGIFLLFQIFFHLILGSYFNRKSIRKILKPIDEIALQADEISRNTFNDGKFQILENAIENLHPEEEGLLSLEDPEFAGIEAAMNNLLIRMRETNRQQARFVNDASHELRTPISVLKGYADMLDRWGKEDKKVLDESIQAILHEVNHMNILVEQLLFLARGDSGRTKLNKEPVCLNDLMQEIYEESFMIDEEHVYRFSRSDIQINVLVDVVLFKQAVRILVDNAAKYTEKGGEIFLKTGQTESGQAFLQIQDTGIGMEQKDVLHMFERFYRSDEARGYKGTGLGLSIAKWIVDMHHGYFEILSRTELGTRIRIIL